MGVRWIKALGWADEGSTLFETEEGIALPLRGDREEAEENRPGIVLSFLGTRHRLYLEGEETLDALSDAIREAFEEERRAKE